MKLKNCLLLLSMMLVIIPIRVNAFTGSVSVICTPNEVKANENVSCKITGQADEKVSSIEIKFSHGDSVSVQSFTPTDGWEGNDVSNNSIDIYGNEVSGNFDIGTLNVKVNSNADSGQKTISFNDILFYGLDDKEHEISDVSAKFTVITGGSEENTKGLKSLSVTGGVLSPPFDKSKTSYTINLSQKTFSINAVPANSSDNLVYTAEKNGQNVTIEPSNISYFDSNNQGMMKIILTVGSGQSETKYDIYIVPPEDTSIGKPTLSSLTVGGKNVTLSNNKFDYIVTLDDVSSYRIKATLSDSKNFEFSDFLDLSTTFSGEQDIPITIIKKADVEGVSEQTYLITVKKKSSTNSGTTGGNNVTSNPQTSGVSAFVMASVLIVSLIASISLYKKNLNGYN